MSRADSPLKSTADVQACIGFVTQLLLEAYPSAREDLERGALSVSWSGCNVWIRGAHGKRATNLLHELGARWSPKRNAYYIRADIENGNIPRKWEVF